MRKAMLAAGAAAIGLLAGSVHAKAGLAKGEPYDLLIRHGVIYNGSGGAPFAGEVAIRGDRIAYVGPHAPGRAKETLDAHGQSVSPGFINMLAHPEESLMVDGRALSDLTQGVTLEVMGEGWSQGPVTDAMAATMEAREADIKYKVTWRSFGEWMQTLERRGVSPNIASFVGAATVRIKVLGEDDVQPTAGQLAAMRTEVKTAMEEGALGLGSALIYAPATYARTPELIALAAESGRCGGIYISHMRSEGDRLLEAVDETIEIARASGAPAEIYHLKAAGKANWGKLDAVIARVEDARARGVRITADQYNYTAGATGLDAAMPPWVQAGGLEAWTSRLKDPAIRARVAAEMRDARGGWENLLYHAGAKGTLLLAFKNDALKPLTGKTLAEVADLRHESPEEAAIDLVIEDGSRVGVAYFLMSEENVKRQAALPWLSFGSDEQGAAPEGVFLKSNAHPRAYGNFTRLLAEYVRKDHVLTLAEAVRKLSALPAANLSLEGRGMLKAGYFADVVVFDPATVQDHATFEKPHQLSTGVSTVIVNGGVALRDGVATGEPTGRFIHGRAWTGAGGQCRASATDWTWSR